MYKICEEYWLPSPNSPNSPNRAVVVVDFVVVVCLLEAKVYSGIIKTRSEFCISGLRL